MARRHSKRNTKRLERRLIITVHGIRTYGDWQERLEQLVGNKIGSGSVQVLNYKYGYFSVLAFIIPLFRWLVVRRFRSDLIDWCGREDWCRIDLIGHSFGTHVLAWALHGIVEDERPKIHTIVLAGSVLRGSFPWRDLVGSCVQRVVNDCGSRDTVLVVNQLVVLFTGMAGRAGFSGATHGDFRNRFFVFGHSGYFLDARGKPDDNWMNAFWMPILADDGPIAPIDRRPKPTLIDGVVQTLANNAEPFKLIIYLAPVVLAGIWIFGLYQDAKTESDRARNALARILSERAWSALGEGRSNLATRYALAGQRLAPTNAPHYRAPLSRTLFPDVPAETIRGHSAKIFSIAVSPDGSRAVSAGADGQAILWSRHPLRKLKTFPHEKLLVLGATFDPSGSFVLTISADGVVRFWHAQSGMLIRSIAGPERDTKRALFSPDGSHILTESSDNSVLIWDILTGNLVLTVHGATTAAFRPDGRTIAIGRNDGTVRLLNLQTGRARGVPLGTHKDEVTVVVFGRDGKTLATGSVDGVVRIWDAGTGEALSQPLLHGNDVKSIAFSADGLSLHVIDIKGNAYVWDAKSSRIRTANPNWADDVSIAEFGFQGRFALVGRASGRITMWDAQASRNVVDLRGEHPNPVTAVGFFGSAVAVGDRSGNLTIFDLHNLILEINDLVQQACSQEIYKTAKFSWLETAADPLIREIWQPSEGNRLFCE